MKLRFAGTGSAFNTAMGNTSAFFTRGDDLFLIDCGEVVFARLMKAGIFEKHPGSITVILTHMHADHCGSLSSLCLYAAEALKRPITLVHPNEDVQTLLALMGAQKSQYTLQRDYMRDDLTITPMPARHVPAIPAFSYLLTDEEGTVYYSGDTGDLPPDILDGLHSGQIIHAYQDTNIFDKTPDRPIHLPLATLTGLVPPPLRPKFTLMHLNRDFHEEATQEGFACATVDPLFQP